MSQCSRGHFCSFGRPVPSRLLAPESGRSVLGSVAVPVPVNSTRVLDGRASRPTGASSPVIVRARRPGPSSSPGQTELSGAGGALGPAAFPLASRRSLALLCTGKHSPGVRGSQSEILAQGQLRVGNAAGGRLGSVPSWTVPVQERRQMRRAPRDGFWWPLTVCPPVSSGSPHPTAPSEVSCTQCCCRRTREQSNKHCSNPS